MEAPTPTVPAAPPRRPSARRGAALLASAVLVTGLAGCGLSTAAPGDASGSTSAGSTSSSADASPSDRQDTAGTPVGDAAGTALPSVVTISVTSGQASASGSGSVLDTDGHILTNTHVVTMGGATDQADVTVRTSDGKVYAAEVVGTDPLSDLAVLKIDAPDLTPIRFGSSEDLKVGDEAVAIGAPLGLPNTVTDGIVSTLDRTIAVASSEAPSSEDAGATEGTERFRFPTPGGQPTAQQGEVYINVLQTDAAINPGNSGGALVDAQGRLIGVNVAIASAGGSSASGQESGNIGVGFAIPADYARRVADDLIQHGSATHGMLGVSVTPEPAEVHGAEGDAATVFSDGARVREVVEGSPAADAGLRAGDVITAVGDRTVGDTESLTAVVREYREGETATVTYLRDGQEQTAEVTVDATEAGR